YYFACYVAHRDLHSFPTRRSSDLSPSADPARTPRRVRGTRTSHTMRPTWVSCGPVSAPSTWSRGICLLPTAIDSRQRRTRRQSAAASNRGRGAREPPVGPERSRPPGCGASGDAPGAATGTAARLSSLTRSHPVRYGTVAAFLSALRLG